MARSLLVHLIPTAVHRHTATQLRIVMPVPGALGGTMQLTALVQANACLLVPLQVPLQVNTCEPPRTPESIYRPSIGAGPAHQSASQAGGSTRAGHARQARLTHPPNL